MTQSNQKPSNKNLKRASVPGAGGSITVEAALSVPIFFFAVVCLIYFIEIHNVQTTIRAAAVHASKICTEDTALVPVLNTSKLESEIVRSIGAKRLENSIVSGGSKGIQCAGSYCNPNGNELNVVVRYGIRLPFLQFGNLSAEYKEEMKFSSWNGSSILQKQGWFIMKIISVRICSFLSGLSLMQTWTEFGTKTAEDIINVTNVSMEVQWQEFILQIQGASITTHSHAAV